MRRIRKVIILRIAIAGLAACGTDRTTPHPGDDRGGGSAGMAAPFADPIGGTSGGGGTRWDVTAMTITPDSNGITVVLESSSDARSPFVDGEATVTGVEFDVEQDASTGAVSGLYPKRWFGFPTPANEGTILRGGVRSDPSAYRK